MLNGNEYKSRIMKGEYLAELLKRKKAGDYIYEAGATSYSIRKVKILFINEDGALMKYVDGNTFYAQGSWKYFETKEEAVQHAIDLCEESIQKAQYEIEKLKKL